jgi:hypothetical protein
MKQMREKKEEPPSGECPVCVLKIAIKITMAGIKIFMANCNDLIGVKRGKNLLLLHTSIL